MKVWGVQRDRIIAYRRDHPTATPKDAAAALDLLEAYVRKTFYRLGYDWVRSYGGKGHFSDAERKRRSESAKELNARLARKRAAA